jgi:hypothetical protein
MTLAGQASRSAEQRTYPGAGVRRTVVTHWHWPDDKPWWRRWQCQSGGVNVLD